MEDQLPSFARAWMAQWRAAGPALAEQKRHELRALTDDQARAATDALLELGASLPLHSSRESSSGLVTQQAVLHSRRFTPWIRSSQRRARSKPSAGSESGV